MANFDYFFLVWQYSSRQQQQQKTKTNKERKKKGQPAEPLDNNKGVEGEQFGKLTSSSFFCLTNSVKSLMFLTRLLKGHSGPMSCKTHNAQTSTQSCTAHTDSHDHKASWRSGWRVIIYKLSYSLRHSSSIASFKPALKTHLFSSGLSMTCLCKHVHVVVCHCFHVGMCVCVRACERVCVCAQVSMCACTCACMCLGSDEKEADWSVAVWICN